MKKKIKMIQIILPPRAVNSKVSTIAGVKHKKAQLVSAQLT